ncbi:MAG: outer membrane protein insertion porin family, partial [Bradyrhizobium sp.]|nr:outer membrane protein insertion porin family [Bradyrhizobium sp.]
GRAIGIWAATGAAAGAFGPLTVDYAVPLTKAAYDVVQPLHFGAGGF